MGRAGLSRRGRRQSPSRSRMRPGSAAAVALLPLLVAGCAQKDTGNKGAPAVLASDESASDTITMVGVAPADFHCSSMATTKEVGAIVGAKVVLRPSQFQPPQGVAAPCNYVEVAPAAVAGGNGPQHPKAKHAKHAKAKHAKHAKHAKAAKRAQGADDSQGATGAKEWTVDFDCRATAIKDAESLMVQYAKTNGATPVRVGKSGLDYENAALLFIDDDSRCYARVLGPGAKNRLAIAKLVAGRLTTKTAPMTPVVRRTASSR